MMAPPTQPHDYNLLELFKQNRTLVDVLDDPTALFVLVFVNEIGGTTRAGLQSELALTPDEFTQIITDLNRAELLGTQVGELYVTEGGRTFLDDLGLSGGALPPATSGGQPVTGGTPGWLWATIAFLATGAVALVAILAVAAVILFQPQTTPTVVAEVQIDFTADRTNIVAGECANLSWEVHNAAWVEVNGARVPPIDRMSICPEKSTSYTLNAGGGTGAQRSILINVEARPTPIPPPTSVPPTAVPPTFFPPPTAPPTPLPGALKGNVYRADKLPFYKAVVQVTGLSYTTGDNGSFSFPALAPGSYVVRASAPGYFDQQNNVTIVTGQTATLFFSMIKAPSAQATNLTLRAQDCFDFDQAKYYPIPSGVEFYTCPSDADVQWWTSTLRAVNGASISTANPQDSAYEDCTNVVVSPTPGISKPQEKGFYCVFTNSKGVAVVNVTTVDPNNRFIVFDWWLY